MRLFYTFTLTVLVLAAGMAVGAPLPEYPLPIIPANIAPTSLTTAGTPPRVYGQPRQSVGHPSTYWDQDDVAQYKKALVTNRMLQDSLNEAKKEADPRLLQPLGVPEASPNPPTREDYNAHGKNSFIIEDMGILYALTGEEKYGNYCRDMLLAYARNYPKYQHPAGWTLANYNSANDGRLTGQFLDDGFWLMRVAFGYDLIYNLPSLTPADKKVIHDGLLEPVASEFYHPIEPKELNYINTNHNRAAICTAATLMAGYATEDVNMVNIALYGNDGTADKPTGGVMGAHFSSKGIREDGLWNEGAPAYQLGILSCALVSDAEVLWHHGIDMYSFRGGVFKRLLDSALTLAYPDARLNIPALHDSAPMSLLDKRNYVNTEVGVPYECGYRRYHDPRYVPIIRNATRQIFMTIHSAPPSLFLDLPPEAETPVLPVTEPANFYAVGYGVLRQASENGPNQLIMEYGPTGGHSHPSKLAIDVYALGDCLMPFPGVIYPYTNPMDPKWYWTTLGNCALSVDEKSQVYEHTLYLYGPGTPRPEATQTVFGPGATLSLQRGWSNTAYSYLGVSLDRALFLTPHYLADLHAAWSEAPHRYDLAWHLRGKLDTDLPLQSWQFPEPAANGYNALTDVRKAQTSQPWSATVTTAAGKKVWFRAPAGSETEVISGNGYYFSRSPNDNEVQPTVLERRSDQKNVLFGNVVDMSGNATPYVQSVTQQGGVEAGYGLLQVETTQGTDLCYVAYRPGSQKAGGLETNAQQAMVTREVQEVRAMYLAGGTSLRVGAVALIRSEPGLAYVETLADGNIVLANPAPTPATISVTLPALVGRHSLMQNSAGQSTGKGPNGAADGSCTIQLAPGSKLIFSKSN